MKVSFLPASEFDNYLNQIIDQALKEDIREGDHTTLATIPENAKLKAFLLAKEKGIIAGVSLAQKILHRLDKNIEFQIFFNDGQAIEKGDKVFIIEGSARAILTGERLMLNFLQHLSGIATYTRQLSDMVRPYGVKLLDTRKTIPGLRYLEKWAVSVGGGYNHRIGLFDMILIKDNHIDFNGSLSRAVKATVDYLKRNSLNLKIEVEVRNFGELEEALSLKEVDRIMLDNFHPADLKKAVRMVNGKKETEASGGINDKNIVEYAATGVDYISVGALTHTVRPVDLSLLLEK